MTKVVKVAVGRGSASAFVRKVPLEQPSQSPGTTLGYPSIETPDCQYASSSSTRTPGTVSKLCSRCAGGGPKTTMWPETAVELIYGLPLGLRRSASDTLRRSP